MSKSIPLKEIVGFLPYGLKMVSSTEGRSAYDRIEKRRLKKVEEAKCSNIDFLLFLKRKPTVRPLSYLTKEITHNGETFVPLKELFDIVFNIEHEEFVISNPIICLRVSDSTQKLEFDIDSKCFWVEELNDDGNDWNPPHNQLELFQKLYEWHFDVYDWIKYGLAVDINTL